MAATCTVYTPSELDSKRFWDKAVAKEKSAQDVPDGFPKKLDSPLVWKGVDIESKSSEWKLDLTDEEIADIDNAVAMFEAKYGDDLSHLSNTTFELPAPFSSRLRKLSDQLYKGVGFQIIHGLDPAKYTPKQKVIMYAGVTAHVCPQRGFVDVFGKGVVAHVVNVQAGKKNPETTAPAFSDVPLSFHTDNCEIMAFYYLDTAPVGGRTVLSSIWQTYNELAEHSPEVLHTLTEPWVMDTFKPLSIQAPRHVRPLQLVESPNSPVLFRFSRYPVTGFQRSRTKGIPPPTAAQREAADAIQFRAARNALTLPVEKGDILLVNDMALFHAREGFDDGGVPLKRHLIKMYFRDPAQGWAIPLWMEQEWKTTYGPAEIEDGTDDKNGVREESWDYIYRPGLEELSMLNG